MYIKTEELHETACIKTKCINENVRQRIIKLHCVTYMNYGLFTVKKHRRTLQRYEDLFMM